MGLLAAIGVLLPFPFYYWLWTNPQSWVNLCGKERDPSKVMAQVSHCLKVVQFISLYTVSSLPWPPPLYFWPLFGFGQFLNFSLSALFWCLLLSIPAFPCVCLCVVDLACPIVRLLVREGIRCWKAVVVYQLLGESGTYYGVRFGKNIPWVSEFPFGVIRDPQYVGSIISLIACLSWVPFQYILLWILGYAFMMHLESSENSATRAKPLS